MSNKQVDTEAVEAIVSTLQSMISKGVNVTSSDMFKYTNAYSAGDESKELPEQKRKAA